MSACLAIVSALLLAGCGEQDPDQPVTIKSSVGNIVLVVPRGYFVVPPPKDGLYTNATAESFMADYPGLNYKSAANLPTFLEVGSADVVTFGIRFEQGRSAADLLAYKLDWYGKEADPSKASANGLHEYATKASSTSPFKNNDLFAADIGEATVLDCGPHRVNQSPRCEMNFEWEGFLVTAGFSRERLSEWKNIKEKISSKFFYWRQGSFLRSPA